MGSDNFGEPLSPTRISSVPLSPFQSGHFQDFPGKLQLAENAGHSFVVPQTKLSWTDEFFAQIRIAQQADALAPDDGQADAEDEDNTNNLAALQHLGGFRHWLIYRPHRLGPAPHTRLELRVQPTTTIEDIHGQLLTRWPDLLPGMPSWSVEAVHPTALSVAEFPENSDLELFVVVADADMQDQEDIVVLLEAQHWTLSSSDISSDSCPMVLSQAWRMIDLGGHLGFPCSSTMCPVWRNGVQREPHQDLAHEAHGIFVSLHVVEDNQLIHSITGNLWVPPTPARPQYPAATRSELPTAFTQAAVHHLQRVYLLSLLSGVGLLLNIFNWALLTGTDGPLDTSSLPPSTG